MLGQRRGHYGGAAVEARTGGGVLEWLCVDTAARAQEQGGAMSWAAWQACCAARALRGTVAGENGDVGAGAVKDTVRTAIIWWFPM